MDGSRQSPNGQNRRIDRGRGYKIDGDQVEIYDLDLAAYLTMRTLPLAESIRMGREFIFRFFDPDGKVGSLAIDYVNSEAARFADAQRRLKKVVISRPAR